MQLALSDPPKRSQPLGGIMGKKLYVGNLPFSATDDMLSQTFSTYGEVESAKIILDRDSGRSKGFGFVEMSSEGAAEEAIDKLNGQMFEGRAITVNEARPMAPRNSGFGGNNSNYSNRGGRNSGGRY